MEIRKKFIGSQVLLSPTEIKYCENSLVLENYLRKLKINQDESATFRVAPWCFGSKVLMKFFVEGLGEAGFTIHNVHSAGKGVDIITKEY